MSILIIALLISVLSAILGYWSEFKTPAGVPTPSLSAICAPGSIVFEDDFEYRDPITNHDWISLSTAGPAQTQSETVAQGLRALKMNDLSSSSPNTYIHEIPTIEGNFQVEFYLRTEQYEQTVYIQLQGNEGFVDSRYAGIVVELSDNVNRGFRVQDKFYFMYQLNKWYHIRLIVRSALQSFDIYVDNMNNPLGKNIKFTNTSFNRIALGTATGGIGSGYWDGITVKCLP